METLIVDNRFENGKRVCTQEVTYEKSDDLFTLANLQRQYENVCLQIRNAKEGTNIEYLKNQKEKLALSIACQEDIIKGYSEKGEQSNETNETTD